MNRLAAMMGVVSALALTLAPMADAAVIGRMTPAEPLTPQRLTTLPPSQRAAWRAYLERSEAARRQDEATLLRERQGRPAPLPAAHPGGDLAMPLDREPGWYATAQARGVADVIVSFQTPAGGWGKNQPRSGPVRQPGQAFAGDEYVGTIDNGATVTELRFLAKVVAARPADGQAYRASFERGVRYLLAAQYPNGGWPQIWPLAGGYHDAVTFNDDAMVGALALLGEVGSGAPGFGFVEPRLRQAAKAAWVRGLDCLLSAQVTVGGVSAGWPQQADALTLRPVGARNFEPAALATAETAGILRYLMSLDSPSPAVVRAVHGAAAWLEGVKISGKAWALASTDAGRRLVDQPGAQALWARYRDLQTGQPIFGDRDLSIHDDVNEISKERRNGYAWFGVGPGKVLERYRTWSAGRP